MLNLVTLRVRGSVKVFEGDILEGKRGKTKPDDGLSSLYLYDRAG